MSGVSELGQPLDHVARPRRSDQDLPTRPGRWVRVSGETRCSPGTGGALRIDMLCGGAALRIAGDIDANTIGALRRALEMLPADGDYHLYLEDLDFISVTGVTVLMQLAGDRSSGRLILHSPPRSLLRVAALAWPGNLLEIRP